MGLDSGSAVALGLTGLELAVDELVEIAVVVTDFELKILDPGFQIVIKPDASALENMNDFVTYDGSCEQYRDRCFT